MPYPELSYELADLDENVTQAELANASMTTHYAERPLNATTVTVPEKPSIMDTVLEYFGFSTNEKNPNDNSKCTARQKGIFALLGFLLIIFITSFIVFFVMWFTKMYDDSLLANLVLLNGSIAVDWWKRPPLSPQLRVHIFNYTNVDDFLSGKHPKLIVKDLGPYVYVEEVEKVNVQFHDNDTVSYQENRICRYHPELSNGKIYDQVIVPNVPVLGALHKADSFSMRIMLSTLVASSNSGPFKKLAADSFLWGYEDEFMEMVNKFTKKFDNFGMLSTRNGTHPDVFNIFSGVEDINKLGIIDRFNGKDEMNYWGTPECNKVGGTDGTQFPPSQLDKKQVLQVFIKAMCRKFPLIFDSEVNLFDGVPAWRYKAPASVFAHPNENPENDCYCHKESGTCPPSGLFNSSACFDAPVMMSYPHFLGGDPVLFEKIEGLHPNEREHLTYADIHPRLAFPIDGASRFQINVEVKNTHVARSTTPLPNDLILPILWLEVVAGELSEELRAMIYHSTFSANAIQLGLQYGSLLICVTSLALLVLACYYRKNRDEESSGKTRPVTDPPQGE